MNKVYRKYLWMQGVVLVHLVLLYQALPAQTGQQKAGADTVFLKKGDFLFRNDSFQLMHKDTVMMLKAGEYKVNKNDYENTQKLYDSLAAIMDKRWVTKEVYSLLFSSVARNSIAGHREEHFNAEEAFEKYEGMVINNIYLTGVDILEGSVDDTLLIATSDIGKLTNDLHASTKDWVIRQYLLFRVGDQVNPYVLADNERIIRSLEFIEDARIILRETSAGEVNVHIITKDVLSLGVGGYFHGFDDFRVEAFDKNIFGIGNELRAGVIFNNSYDKPLGYGIQWNYNNIAGLLTDASLQYENTYERKFVRQVVSKQFISPRIRYGGELDVGWRKDVLYDHNLDTLFKSPYENKYVDLWLGRSFLLNTPDRRTNLIIAGRFSNNTFLARPEVDADTNMYFHDNAFFTGSITLKKINYFKSHKIYGFGIVEDIPYGYIGRVIAGKSLSEFFDRPYYGLQLSGGKYLDELGYLWVDSKLGTFWKDGGVNELLWNLNAVYYTPLNNLGRYQNRTIFRLSYNSAINKQDDRGLNFYQRIRGLDDKTIHGLGSYILGMESIFFAPWYFYGFKFAPYAFLDLGIISDEGFKFKNGELYSGFGAGLRIRNESLVFSTISVRLSFVPKQLTNYRHMIFDGSAGRPVLFNNGFDDKPSFNMLQVY